MKPLCIKGDAYLLVAVVLLAVFGVVAIYSASSYAAEKTYGDAYFYVKKQLFGLVVGVILMAFATRINYSRLVRLQWIAPITAVLLLLLVFVPGIGKEVYGAKRWIGFFGVTIQPSEIAKYALVLFSAAYFSKDVLHPRRFYALLPVLTVGGIICLLVIAEPNMSVTMCIAILMASLVFLSGTKIKNIVCIALPIVLLVPILIVIEPYRLSRLSAYLDPWASPKGEGYQLIQSLYALANGGFFGRGLFCSVQKYRFLPFAESDFILSVIAEELGFFGTFLLFGLFFFVSVRGFKIASECRDLYGYLLSMGITLVFTVQTAINALVVSGAIPPTGLPLPLISSGNTSLIVTLTSFGVLYAVSVKNRKEAGILTQTGRK